MEYPILNEAEAIERLGDKDFLKELLQDFTAMKELDWESFDTHLAGKDLEAIELISHTLKGVAGNLALTSIYKISSMLDEAAKLNDWDLISNYYGVLKLEVQRFRAWLPDYLKS